GGPRGPPVTPPGATEPAAHGAEIVIDAPPERVYAMLADVTRMGEWSPECVRCRWIGGDDGARVGARFRGRSRNGWHRWSTVSTVVAAAPGRSFAFEVTYFGLPVATWRYDFRPDEGGRTHLAESVEDRRGHLLRAVSPLITGSRDRGRRNTATITTTLARLKAAAEER
ncbi:MAG TPA: SRPBCC family protein, partial [Acidimicrobiales bacterium]|nr:SRPBCC family protein [Acidimicrobiales bacterium]